MSITSRINNHDRVFCLLTPPSGDQHGMGSLAHRVVTTPCDRGLERERGESELQRGGVKTKPRLRPKKAAVLFRHEKREPAWRSRGRLRGEERVCRTESTRGLLCLCRAARVTSTELLAGLILTFRLTEAEDRSQEAIESPGVGRAQSARWGSLPALHPSRPALRKPRRPVALLVRDRIVFFFFPQNYCTSSVPTLPVQ